MGILSSLFSSKKMDKEPVKKVLENPTLSIKESLANLAIEVVGTSENAALAPLRGDSISTKYEELIALGLENSANARFLKQQLDNINNYNNAILKAQELLKYIESINILLGNSVILVSTDAFYTLCHKYGLSIGYLHEFTGVIPSANLEELMDISQKLHYNINILDINKNIERVKGISNYSSKSGTFIQEYLSHTFNIVRRINGYGHSLSKTVEFENEDWAKKVYFEPDSMSRDSFFIACPKSNLQEKLVITNKLVDPIIFQYCPFGVLIYTMWGEEAEDKVFEEYKKLKIIK